MIDVLSYFNTKNVAVLLIKNYDIHMEIKAVLLKISVIFLQW